jgi:hypothetical protein
MLRQENAVGVARPTRTSLPNVIGTELWMKVPAGHCTANVFDEPTHDTKCGTQTLVAQPPAPHRRVGGRSVRCRGWIAVRVSWPSTLVAATPGRW